MTWSADGAIGPDPNEHSQSWRATFEFVEDGTYRMHGYPKIDCSIVRSTARDGTKST